MMRDWIAAFALMRERRHEYLAEFWIDVRTWVTHRDTWREIRARRQKQPPQQPIPRVTYSHKR